MPSWVLRILGLILMAVGGGLFVWAVKYISAEWPQIFVGILSVFCTSMGFGMVVMPSDDPDGATKR